MFARPQRLHTPKTILATLRQGERKTVGCVTCYFLAKAGTLGKATVIVDTKVSKKAVERNYLKRQVRAILRELGLPTGFLVVRLQRGAVGIAYPTLYQQLQQCLQRVSSTQVNARS